MNRQSSKTIYKIDPKTDLFLFTEEVSPDETGHYQIPGNSVLVIPPEYSEQQWLRWLSNIPRTNHQFGQESTGEWEIINDYRKTDLYLTSNGQKYSLDSKQNIDDEEVSFIGYGELPSWLTTKERPTEFHNWESNTKEWVFDEEAFDNYQIDMERGWRDGELNSILWLRDRHRDEVEQELNTSLSEEQYIDLQAYIQSLRDWPAQAEFPESESRPEKPQWLAEY